MPDPKAVSWKITHAVVQRTRQIDFEHWRLGIVLGVCLLGAVLKGRSAGYDIKTQVETTAEGNRYTWIVYNLDESWGLDMLAIEVPADMRVLASEVPPPYSNPHGTAYWIMQERHEAWIDPHDQRVIIPEPPRGRKWLLWWGMQSPSVYPLGTSVAFSVTTDAAVKPGNVRGFATTYTPQNNPHYYLPWPQEVIGPSPVIATTPPSITNDSERLNPRVLAGPIVSPINGHSYFLLAESTWSQAEAQAIRLGAAEDQWVYSTFEGYGGAMWIGLTDRAKVFEFTWVSGESITYRNWAGGQPDNGTGGVEYYAHILPRGHQDAPGRWNDYADEDTVLGFPLFGVVELIPKSAIKVALTPSSPSTIAEALPEAGGVTSNGPELHAYTAIELSWPSESNKMYRVQWTHSLEAPRWTDLEPVITGTGTNVSIFDSTREHPRGFYRVKISH